jgi:hypothetical protein
MRGLSGDGSSGVLSAVETAHRVTKRSEDNKMQDELAMIHHGDATALHSAWTLMAMTTNDRYFFADCAMPAVILVILLL